MPSVEESLAAFYDARAVEEPATDPEASIRFDKAIAAASLASGERVLDLGAKWGGLGRRIAETGVDVQYTGLDLSDQNCRAAGELGLDVRQADLTARLPLADAAYDCVFCLELLEHLTAPLGLLQEMRRVLAKDGRAVISVPSPYSWVEVFRELFHRHDMEGHLASYTTPVMRNLVGLAGFRLERTTGTSIRIPRTGRLIATNSILARSRIYLIRPADTVVLAGREFGAVST